MTESHVPADAPWTPPELAPELVRKLATGRYDALAGPLHPRRARRRRRPARAHRRAARAGSERDPAATLMRTLLCFGDSNTWGYIPGSNGRRFPREVRWPVRLQLGAGRRVGGDRGRAERPHRDDGQPRRRGPERAPVPRAVPALARAGRPARHLPRHERRRRRDSRCRSATWRGRSAGSSRSRARPRPGPGGGAPEILVVCPPPFDGHRLGPHFAEMCSELGCELLDLDGVASYVVIGDDVEHLDEAAHAAVAIGGRGARAAAAAVTARRYSRPAADPALRHRRARAGCGSTRSRGSCRTSRPTTSSTRAGRRTSTSGSCGERCSTSRSRSSTTPRSS